MKIVILYLKLYYVYVIQIETNILYTFESPYSKYSKQEILRNKDRPLLNYFELYQR